MVSKKVLTVFTQLTDEEEATKPDLCVRLWNYLNYLNQSDSAEVIFSISFFICSYFALSEISQIFCCLEFKLNNSVFFCLHCECVIFQQADEENSENTIPLDVEYVLRRLIQGLGSARAFIRKNYFATLTSLVSQWNFSHSQISLSYFKSLVDQYLCKSESRGVSEQLPHSYLMFHVGIHGTDNFCRKKEKYWQDGY